MKLFPRIIVLLSCLQFGMPKLMAQLVPARAENIPYLITFGKDASTEWGDDDFSQTFFFVVPESTSQPVFFRVFDPDCGGAIDEAKGGFDAKTTFYVYGGKGAISEEEARSNTPTGNYKSGNLLDKKSFGVNERYDQQWYTFGPFEPTQGELAPEYGGYVFKVIAEGASGNDGNLYKYFMSLMPGSNKAVEGGNAFTFEYTFRMHNDGKEVSHMYPHVNDKVVLVKQSNFDWDADGFIRIASVAQKGEFVKLSGDDDWAHSAYRINAAEKGGSLDIQFIKNTRKPVKNNNVTFSIANQNEELLPFYTAPIGDVPKYQYSIGVRTK